MQSDYLKRTIIREELSSKYLGETRLLQIYLPPGYSDENRYPVLYLQDGTDYLTLGRIATQTNQLIAEGRIHPPIIVMIPVDKARRNEEYAPGGDRFEAYGRFVADELLPRVESRFAARQEPGGRVIGGSSLGATVSLHMALDFPDRFRRVLSQSGAFFKATLDRIRQAPTLADLEVYQMIGLEEYAVPTHVGNLDLLARNREVSRALREKGASLRYVEKEGKHTWGLWQKDLPEALTHFFGKTADSAS
ncbi:Enterochelin esterase [Planifilum fulgidum]|uniref:Enterochelin esterase n=1 Tax=Planifilum fulgidum TaxID=201973 RepID=A0A1I2NZC1_9BACL|nr:alpha/beta hydrolase-fold protein [Planifilum fulgidum]SFG08793.1 Enterochelin esterase [Planifilum fulgidum]